MLLGQKAGQALLIRVIPPAARSIDLGAAICAVLVTSFCLVCYSEHASAHRFQQPATSLDARIRLADE